MPDDSPKPDANGWLRVTDKDTGHKRSIRESELPHGNYTPLKADASDPLTGLPLAPEFHTVEPTKSGQSAGTTKEKADG